MSAIFGARMLSGVAAGLTMTALIAATITVPASAVPQPGPIPPSAKLKLPDGTAGSRVIKNRYLVETVATPLARGGSFFASKASTNATKSAVKAAGATVGSTYSDLWNGVDVTATREQVQELAQSPSVKAIYPVLRVDRPRTTKSATKVSSALSQISALGVTQTGAGIRVGVIDSGIDYNHRDLGGMGVNDQKKDFGLAAPRVKYGRDFVGDAYDPDSDNVLNTLPHEDGYPDDCNGHGTHVAGIIGANGNGDGPSTTGAAPDVTLGAYRVFGCEGSTDTAIILKALSKAKADGMKIVNLSLGSDFDSWPSYPDAVAVANLAKAGVVIVVAAGNSGDTGLFSAGTPAVGAGVISVASYEGATIKTKAIWVNGVKHAYTAVEGTAAAPANNVSQLELKVASAAYACSIDGPLTRVPAGSALLIKRGGTTAANACSFHEKVQNAIAAGAEAAVIYNNVPGLDSFTAAEEGEAPLPIPAISIGGTQGANLAVALTGINPVDPTMTWMDVQEGLVNPDGGYISTFSSAGLAADLSLVPTISAPGAKIYSTLPLEQGGHGNLSGTSMATPYIAGTAALLLEAKSSLKGRPGTLAQQLHNTAVPVPKSTGAGVTGKPEGVFRQGSGLVNVAGALNAKVTASPSTIKLGEGTSHKKTISLTNKTKGTLTYTVSRISGVSAAASTGGGNVGTTTPSYGWADVGFKASRNVTVKAGKTVKVKVKLTAPTSVLRGKAGMLYGGWVQFSTTGAGNTVTVPFVGMRGDYQSVRVLNKFTYLDETNTAWSLPSLGFVDDAGTIQFETGSGRNYTMQGNDVPIVIYHLDYPASDVQLRITDQRTRKSYDAILDDSTYKRSTGKISRKSTHLYRQPRDASAQVIPLVGLYRKGKAYNVYDGSWKMQLRVLKPLGTSSKSKHWETWPSRVFTIR